MRVQLTRSRSADDRDHGAIAIIVAVLTVVIVGLAAFAADFGLAYTSKRNLQNGADAAALAAASEIIKRTKPGDSCATVVTRWNTTGDPLKTDVGGVADSYSTANRTAAARTDMTVACSADAKRVEVSYTNSASTARILGGIFGSGDYTATRTATADVFVPSSGQGLRPYFLCLDDLSRLQAQQSSTPQWVRVQYPNPTATICGSYSGNWYTSDCPLDGNNGTLDQNTRNGCRTEISVIQASNPAVGVTSADVVSACSGLANKVPAPCLTSNPGNVAAQPVVNAWDFLLTQPGIAVPVFDKTWKGWADTGSADCRTGGVGNNGCYPIKAIAGVKVCGYKWNNKDGVDPEESIVGSPCNGVAADLAALPKKDNNNYLWLKLLNVQVTGSSKPATCGVGDATCDAGSRGVRLIK